MPRQRVVFPQSNWKGMVYATDVGDVPPGYAYFAKNMIPKAGVYWRRPSCFAGNQIASGVTANMQGFFVLRVAGGEILIGVYAGEIYATSAGGTSFSKLVSTANLSTASITLNGTGIVYGIQYGATFVFNDGTNQPFTWDGTSGAGGLTKLTNAPSACFGMPAVYYGKLFFIKASDQRTIAWSEENAANTGYEATGYNNAWTLNQMGEGPLFVLIGLNDGLYYFRRTSIGVIRGTVTPDFQASGVHDNVSLYIGSVSPKGVAYYNGFLWFVDATGHPHRIAIGTYQHEAIWYGMRAAFFEEAEFTPNLTDAILREWAVVPIPSMDIMWFCISVVPAGGTAPSRGASAGGGWFFSASTGDCLCNFAIAYTPITNTGIIPGAVHTIAPGSGGTLGVGFATGTAAAGWQHVALPLFGSSAYNVSAPDNAMVTDLKGTPQGDVDAVTRHAFTELRVTFALGRVSSGTSTQAVLGAVNSAASVTQSTLTSQNIANSTTGLLSERVTKTWGLARELPFLIPGLQTTAPPSAGLAWGITSMDVIGYPLVASPAWATK